MNERPVLITGGAGFIGTNLADRLAGEGRPVLLYDNLSRPGVAENVEWLVTRHGELVQIMVADIRDRKALAGAVRRAGPIFHLAAQVAVTTSIADPVHDFEVNARGTLNLLEEVRARGGTEPVLFTSTNKVYGGLEDLRLVHNGTRYYPEGVGASDSGISETRPIELHSPYGCSKGAAEQYMLDYARTFGVPSVIFRMSCIYGPHQFGTEDQGWVAHFLIRALRGEPITLYGDGLQVRDTLYVDDLVDAFLLVLDRADTLAGQVFNIGGGSAHTVSLLELVELIGELRGDSPGLEFRDWRLGDQRYYVSDTGRFEAATGWTPRVGVSEGVRLLHDWLVTSRAVFTARTNGAGGGQSLAGPARSEAVGARH
jgi:CDP-paratose 2-epimerase